MLGDKECMDSMVEGAMDEGEETLLGEGGEVPEVDVGHLVHGRARLKVFLGDLPCLDRCLAMARGVT